MAADDADHWARLRAAAGVTAAPAYQSDLDNVPAPYILDADLAAAAEIAIRLGKPLLLTGDPGTGKTEFAKSLAFQLGFPLQICNIRSTTTVSDLFYTVDELDRFRDAQQGGAGVLPFQYYLTFNGLGRSILFAAGPSGAVRIISGRLARPLAPGALPAAPLTRFDQLYPAKAFPSEVGCRTAVLLDEFDKAPRDTPNDMLNEIEQMRFEVPELGISVEAPRDMRPVTIVTSNSEKSLPDPFLRRCIYYDISFPEDIDRLRLIVTQHLDYFSGGESRLLRETLDLFVKLRRQTLTRRPGTAELLDWLRAFAHARISPANSFRAAWTADPAAMRRSLSAIVKARDDRPKVEAFLLEHFGLPAR